MTAVSHTVLQDFRVLNLSLAINVLENELNISDVKLQ